MGLNTNKTVTNQIVELAGRPGGVSSSDIPGLKADDLAARCCNLVRQGRLHRAGSGRGKVRYFSTLEAAKHFDATVQPVAAVKVHQVSINARWDKDAQVLYNSQTKVTICPPYKPRFEAIECSFVHAANRSGRVAAEVA